MVHVALALWKCHITYDNDMGRKIQTNRKQRKYVFLIIYVTVNIILFSILSIIYPLTKCVPIPNIYLYECVFNASIVVLPTYQPKYQVHSSVYFFATQFSHTQNYKSPSWRQPYIPPLYLESIKLYTKQNVHYTLPLT